MPKKGTQLYNQKQVQMRAMCGLEAKIIKEDKLGSTEWSERRDRRWMHQEEEK